MNLPRTPMGSASGWRPVDPPRLPVLFVNPRSGGGKAARAGLAERARELGVEAVILDPGRTWPRWPVAPLRAARTRWGWSAATGRWRWWPQWRLRTGSRSRAFRLGPATISRSTWAWTGTT